MAEPYSEATTHKVVELYSVFNFTTSTDDSPGTIPEWDSQLQLNAQLKQRLDRLEAAAGLAAEGPCKEEPNTAKKVDNRYTYKLEGSIWDAQLLVFTPQCGISVSIVTLLLLLINCMLQGFFVALVFTELTDEAFSDDSITQLRSWRTNVGHSLQYMDPVSRTSLVARVCNQNAGVELSGLQATYVEQLSRFLADSFLGFGGTIGTLTMACCCFVWTMSVVKELSAISCLIEAIWHGWKSGANQTLQFGWMRCGFSLLVQVWRMAIICSLGYAGILYLGKFTVAIPDLLLNMVALEFILDLDERIFAAFAPTRLAWALDDVGELSMQYHTVGELWPQSRGGRYLGHLDLRTISKLLLMSVAMPIICTFVVIPTTDQLWSASDALCAGAHDFVVTLDPAGAAAWSEVPVSQEVGNDTSRQWYRPASDEGGLLWAERLIDKVIQRPHSAVCPPELCLGCKNDDCTAAISITDEEVSDCCWAARNRFPHVEDGSPSLKSLNTWSIPVYSEFFYGRTIERTIDGREIVFNPECSDTMGGQLSYARSMEYTCMSFTDAVTVSHRVKGTEHLLSTCAPSCSDPYKPFCRNGTCVTPTCATDLISYCSQQSAAGVAARMYCPISCKCDQPDSTNLLRLPTSGCPVHCTSSAAYTTTLTSKACSDEPANSQHLADYANEWRVQTTGQLSILEVYANQFAPHLPALGCAEWVSSMMTRFSDITTQELCGGKPEFGDETGPLRAPITPLSFWCPVACKCALNNSITGCPTACLT